MVRTVRSIEEEARVKRIFNPYLDSVIEDPIIAETLEKDTIKSILDFSSEGVRRVLWVGLEDRGNIALKLANAGLFVTVVEPDNQLIEDLRKKAEEKRCAMQINLFNSSYMEREFQTSGFDLAVFFACLHRFNEPIVVLKKACRELRAGGKIFIRMFLRPEVSSMFGRFISAERIDKLTRFITNRFPALDWVSKLPTYNDFLAEVKAIFKVENVLHRHVIAPFFAYGIHVSPRRIRPILTSLIPLFTRIDTAMIQNGIIPNALQVLILGTKELGLGKTFRVS